MTNDYQYSTDTCTINANLSDPCSNTQGHDQGQGNGQGQGQGNFLISGP